MGENDIDMSTVVKLTIDGKEVTQITDSQGRILWEKVDRRDYFYFEDKSGTTNSVSIQTTGADAPIGLEYSYDKQTWNNWDIAQPLELEANGKVFLRGDNVSLANSIGGVSSYNSFRSTGNVYAGGNIVSLLDKKVEQTDFSNWFTFAYAFENMTTLVEVSPTLCDQVSGTNQSATYKFMSVFKNCSNLTNIPNFAGIVVAKQEDFNNAFNGTAVVDASNAFANVTTTSGNFVFAHSFKDCTRLTTAPYLSNITSIGNNGLYQSFYGCSSLTTAPYLSNVTSIGINGIWHAFDGCTSMTTAPDLSNVTSIGNYGLHSAFYNCSSLVTAPNLSNVTSIDISGLYQTFYGCSKLQTIYAPNIDTWDTSNFSNWVNNAGSSAATPKQMIFQTQALLDDCPSGNSGYGVYEPTLYEKVSTPSASCDANIVTMTCQTTGATIKYSTDGGITYYDYVSPITITETTEFSIYAVKEGIGDSDEITFTAIYVYTVETPTVSCSSNRVTMSCSTTGATIRYSTDGGVNYETYTEPIVINETTVYRVYATKSGMIDSETITFTATYTIYDGFYVQNISDGEGTLTIKGSSYNTIHLQYSDDGISWEEATLGTSAFTHTIGSGDFLYIKGDLVSGSYFDGAPRCISMNCDYKVGGCLISLIDSVNYSTRTTIPNYAFAYVFGNNNETDLTRNLKDISDLNIGSITSVGTQSMKRAFQNCKNITKGIDLTNVTSAQNYSFEDLYKNTNVSEVYAPSLSNWNNSSTLNWMRSTISTGTMYAKEGVQIPTGDSGCPTGWTVQVLS